MKERSWKTKRKLELSFNKTSKTLKIKPLPKWSLLMRWKAWILEENEKTKIFSWWWYSFGQVRKKRKVDFSWVCKLRYVNGWCLGGGSRLGNGGARWFKVVWGGGNASLVVVKERQDEEKWEQRKGNCKKAKLSKWSKMCTRSTKLGIYRKNTTMSLHGEVLAEMFHG